MTTKSTFSPLNLPVAPRSQSAPVPEGHAESTHAHGIVISPDVRRKIAPFLRARPKRGFGYIVEDGDVLDDLLHEAYEEGEDESEESRADRYMAAFLEYNRHLGLTGPDALAAAVGQLMFFPELQELFELDEAMARGLVPANFPAIETFLAVCGLPASAATSFQWIPPRRPAHDGHPSAFVFKSSIVRGRIETDVERQTPFAPHVEVPHAPIHHEARESQPAIEARKAEVRRSRGTRTKKWKWAFVQGMQRPARPVFRRFVDLIPALTNGVEEPLQMLEDEKIRELIRMGRNASTPEAARKLFAEALDAMLLEPLKLSKVNKAEQRLSAMKKAGLDALLVEALLQGSLTPKMANRYIDQMRDGLTRHLATLPTKEERLAAQYELLLGIDAFDQIAQRIAFVTPKGGAFSYPVHDSHAIDSLRAFGNSLYR
jgi:hypothetical protein